MTAESIVRSLYERVAASDFAAVAQLLSDDVLFVQAASLPFGGEWRGKDGFMEMATRINGAWSGFSTTPRTFFASGDSQVAVLASLSGEDLEMDMVELWTVVEGRIARCQPFYFDTASAAQTAKEFPS